MPGRTTPQKTKVVDLDKLLAPALEESAKQAKHAVVRLGGREWHISNDASVVTVFEAFGGEEPNASAIVAYLFGLVADDEQADFRKFLYSLRGLNGEIFNTILTQFLEALGERPTEAGGDSTTPSGTTDGAPSPASSEFVVHVDSGD